MEKPKVYLAGKISYNGWRHQIVTFDDNLELDSAIGEETTANWPTVDCGKFIYTGPYFVGTAHGCYHNTNTHAYRQWPSTETSDHRLSFVTGLCEKTIQQSDLVFAWIDSTDCYGTLAEIGYAVGAGKHVIVASKEYYPDLWFVYAMASIAKFDQETPLPTFNLMLETYYWVKTGSADREKLESPIEEKFWQAWSSKYGHIMRIKPQVHVGRYRIDFAIESLKIAIELDGHDYHKTKKQRTYDAERERYLQRQGWRVIRFTGSEIWRDVNKCIEDLADFVELCEANG